MVDLQRHLHAALLAWSLNIGPTRMAEGDCTSVRRHVTAPSRRRALRSTDRLHEQGEPSGAAPIGVDTSASAGLRHKRGRPAHGPRPAFVLRRNSTTARQETRFARKGRSAVALGADDATKRVRAPQTAQLRCVAGAAIRNAAARKEVCATCSGPRLEWASKLPRIALRSASATAGHDKAGSLGRWLVASLCRCKFARGSGSRG